MGPPANADYDALTPSFAANPSANEYLVVWAGDDDTAPLVDNELEIFGQRLTAAGAQTGTNDLRISYMGPDGSTAYGALVPSAAYSSVDNQFLVVWQGDDDTAPPVDGEVEIFGQRLTAAGVAEGANDFRISDMGPDGSTAYGAVLPSVAHNSVDNQFLATWRGDDDTAPLVDGEFEIFGRRLGEQPAPGGGGRPEEERPAARARRSARLPTQSRRAS